jgi:tripartite ATP-independent transporter DctP family solute receptor
MTYRCALALALAACGGGRAGNQPIQITLGHVGAPGSLFAVSADEFARRANDRLGPRAQVVVFGSSQLGSDEVVAQKLKLGTVDLGLPSTVMSSMVEAFGLFEMPYLIEDRAHMRRIEEAVVWPQLAPLAEAAGYKVLAVWENGFRHITNSRRPIAAPADLRGIKLRTPGARWRVRMFQLYGANPSPLPFSEVFVALQTGVMDGQENPLQQIYAARLHEVQRYLSITGHVYSPAFLTAGLAAWQRLPADVRAILEQTARECQDFVFQAAERLDRELLDSLRASGIAVNQADRARFIDASRAVYDEFAASVPGGGELIGAAQRLRQLRPTAAR